MADELDDGEFWLPSHFLADDDFLTTPACPIHSKVVPLSTSPQSTLFVCDCNRQGSGSGSTSSHGSPTKKGDDDDKGRDNDTLELLNKAAGEVAKMKLRTEKSTKSSGTGFFDCSRTINKQLSSPQPPPPPPPSAVPPLVYFHPQLPRFPPPMMWGPAQLSSPPQQQQTRGTTNNSSNINTNDNKNNTNDDNNNNNNSSRRPLGLPPAAWPLLPGQGKVQVQVQAQATSMFVGPPRESVGTGVFLPRRVGPPAESKKKPDKSTMKTKNNKGSPQKNVHSTKANLDEIQLPSEWVY